MTETINQTQEEKDKARERFLFELILNLDIIHKPRIEIEKAYVELSLREYDRAVEAGERPGREFRLKMDEVEQSRVQNKKGAGPAKVSAPVVQ